MPISPAMPSSHSSIASNGGGGVLHSNGGGGVGSASSASTSGSGLISGVGVKCCASSPRTATLASSSSSSAQHHDEINEYSELLPHEQEPAALSSTEPLRLLGGSVEHCENEVPPPLPLKIGVLGQKVQQHRKNMVVEQLKAQQQANRYTCLLYTSPSPRDRQKSRMPSSA